MGKAHRFIPAWAGNTDRADEGRIPLSVHPRVGGEHIRASRLRCTPRGSSPRGRGTHQPRDAGRSDHRFIPAWAGNTEVVRPIGRGDTVHPRVGGEHIIAKRMLVLLRGSSPRGRGTLLSVNPGDGLRRFIPAWAGNTARPAGCPTWQPVHPRVGGEHCVICLRRSSPRGSSPRGRGTLGGLRHGRPLVRFIPAWAGNTPARASAVASAAVHPRVGGEHQIAHGGKAKGNGSSPRGRGTLFTSAGAVILSRFIPAWAGNTSPRLGGGYDRTVHPRVGGEHT